jgi:hypothetical protein
MARRTLYDDKLFRRQSKATDWFVAILIATIALFGLAIWLKVWVLLCAAIAAFVPLAIVGPIAEWYLSRSFRCGECGGKTKRNRATYPAIISFYCPACDVDWDTGVQEKSYE